MGPWRYLAILAAAAAITLPLEFVLGARVYRRPRRLLITLLPVIVVFGGWDLIAVARGDWWFASRYTIGLHVLGLPIEEWLFFAVIPVCALLTFEVLGPRQRRSRPTGDADSVVRPEKVGDRAR